jgi:hypothetical protein
MMSSDGVLLLDWSSFRGLEVRDKDLIGGIGAIVSVHVIKLWFIVSFKAARKVEQPGNPITNLLKNSWHQQPSF